MALTRIAFDLAMRQNLERSLPKVGRDGTTVDGTNPDFSFGIAMALLEMGLPVADISNVTDAELSGITGRDVKMAIEIARYEALRMALSNWVEPDWVAGTDNEQANGALRESLRKQLDGWREELRNDYGIGDGTGSPATTTGGLGTLTAGTIDLNFAATWDDE